MRAVLAAIVLVSAAAAGAAEPVALVACAPGYPGNTEQAQDSMDAFARGVARAAGWPEQELTAVYYEKLQPGLDRFGHPDAALALVPLAFFVEYGKQLELDPLLEAVFEGRSEETWSLVARKGAIGGATSLDRWELIGMPGYSPEFVQTVLADWGTLPESANVTFTARIVSALRKAAAGHSVAVLLDGAQSAALDSLPFASDLEVVTRSKPVVGSLLCRVGERIDAARADELSRALLQLHETEQGAELLATIRLSRFQKLGDDALSGVSLD